MAKPVVCAFLIQNDKVWMGQRPRHKHMGGLWEFPGGKVDDGESEEQALRRELQEELGIEAIIEKKIGEVEYAYPDRVIRLMAYQAKPLNTISLNEHINQQWISTSAVPDESWAAADIALWQNVRV